jgi:hypothetical protein
MSTTTNGRPAAPVLVEPAAAPQHLVVAVDLGVISVPAPVSAVIDITDLLTLVNAVAWASEQTPDDPHVLNRLLTFVVDGLA